VPSSLYRDGRMQARTEDRSSSRQKEDFLPVVQRARKNSGVRGEERAEKGMEGKHERDKKAKREGKKKEGRKEGRTADTEKRESEEGTKE